MWGGGNRRLVKEKRRKQKLSYREKYFSNQLKWSEIMKGKKIAT
jgi:hypothetical protein